MRLTRIPLAACLSLAVLAAGCGGDDDDGGDAGGGSGSEPVEVGEAPAAGAEQEVAAAITKWARSGNTTAKCGQLLTIRLVNEIYGAREQCVESADDNPQAQIKGAKVGDVAVKGDTATAQLSTQAEGLAVSGQIKVARQQGTWRVDDFSDELLRDLTTQLQDLSFRQLAAQSEDKRAPKLAADIGLADCIDEGLDKLPGNQMRQSLIKSLGLGDTSRRLGRITAGCVTQSASGRQLLRLNFETNLRSSLPAAKQQTCMIGALRKSVDDDLIAAVGGQVFSGVANAAKEQELQSKVREAGTGCGVKLG